MYGMTISFSLLAVFLMENKALMAFFEVAKATSIDCKKYFVIVRCAGSAAIWLNIPAIWLNITEKD